MPGVAAGKRNSTIYRTQPYVVWHQLWNFIAYHLDRFLLHPTQYSLLDLFSALIEQKSLISCTFTLVLLSKRIDSIHNLHWPIRGLGNITWLLRPIRYIYSQAILQSKLDKAMPNAWTADNGYLQRLIVYLISIFSKLFSMCQFLAIF